MPGRGTNIYNVLASLVTFLPAKESKQLGQDPIIGIQSTVY